MKLTILEDGVLDYKGRGATLAVPNAVPSGSMGAGVKHAPKARAKNTFEEHIKDCPSCSSDKLCDFGKNLANR